MLEGSTDVSQDRLCYYLHKCSVMGCAHNLASALAHLEAVDVELRKEVDFEGRSINEYTRSRDEFTLHYSTIYNAMGRIDSIFNNFASAPHWILEHNYGATLLHYLDDFLLFGPPGLSTFQDSMSTYHAASFAMKFLFPTAEDDHPILKPVQFPPGSDLSEATKQLQLFKKLVLDKRVLLVMIRTLEERQGRFDLQDRAIKSQLEKGPVDVITGEARNSLSEEKLLRQHLDVNVVEGVVENENEVIPIKLLDTDTISQAKENILDALYKNTTVSRRPELGEVDLELRRGNARAGLYDYNEKDGEWVKVNTHGHDKLDQMGNGYYEQCCEQCPPFQQSQLYVKNSKNPQPRFMLAAHSEVALGSASFDIIGASMASNSPMTPCC
ncbi:hypothetical protein EMCRGX_G027191 [Ephydatia muelleri]